MLSRTRVPAAAQRTLTPSQSWCSLISLERMKRWVGVSNVSQFLAQGNFAFRQGVEPGTPASQAGVSTTTRSKPKTIPVFLSDNEPHVLTERRQRHWNWKLIFLLPFSKSALATNFYLILTNLYAKYAITKNVMMVFSRQWTNMTKDLIYCNMLIFCLCSMWTS